MKVDYINELILVEGLKKGDSKAYTYLVDTYHHMLCSYAYSLIGDKDLSEDIVQTVFIKIWKRRQNLKSNINLKNYLYKSVYNSFIDQYRKMRPVFSLEKIHIDTLKTSIEEDYDNSFEKLVKLVKLEIDNLPPKCRETFLLSRQDGLTNIEIAEHLNVSIKAVEAHLTKAFKILRNTVGEKLNGVLFLLFGAGKSSQLNI